MDELLIDVSYHQGNIDWDRIKADGKVKAAMLRAGYGAGNIDTRFVENVKACNRLGIPCGVYWFSYAYTADMAEREAQYCIGAIRPYKIDLPVAFDWEYDSKARAKTHGVDATLELTIEMATRFCEAVRAAGYTPMLYTNPDYINRHFPMYVLPGVDRWIAKYSEVKPAEKHTIWQHGTCKINGIGGEVDVNHLYKDYISKPTVKRNILTEGRYKLLRDLPDWGDSAIRPLVQEGSLRGEVAVEDINDTQIDLSKDMLRVIKVILDHMDRQVDA